MASVLLCSRDGIYRDSMWIMIHLEIRKIVILLFCSPLQPQQWAIRAHPSSAFSKWVGHYLLVTQEGVTTCHFHDINMATRGQLCSLFKHSFRGLLFADRTYTTTGGLFIPDQSVYNSTRTLGPRHIHTSERRPGLDEFFQEGEDLIEDAEKTGKECS